MFFLMIRIVSTGLGPFQLQAGSKIPVLPTRFYPRASGGTYERPGTLTAVMRCHMTLKRKLVLSAVLVGSALRPLTSSALPDFNQAILALQNGEVVHASEGRLDSKECRRRGIDLLEDLRDHARSPSDASERRLWVKSAAQQILAVMGRIQRHGISANQHAFPEDQAKCGLVFRQLKRVFDELLADAENTQG